ncbi:MAG: hypothetical protein LBO09_01995 [Candidatus Peribacteria bacterium]|nr:hypothetical protein [Candidatus Peribacteria bacterium]
MAIPLGTGYLYVAPGSTDQPKINSVAPIYCLNLDLGESDWYLPDLNDPSQRLALYDTKSKLNNFVAGGASKANHYWTSW